MSMPIMVVLTVPARMRDRQAHGLHSAVRAAALPAAAPLLSLATHRLAAAPEAFASTCQTSKSSSALPIPERGRPLRTCMAASTKHAPCARAQRCAARAHSGLRRRPGSTCILGLALTLWRRPGSSCWPCARRTSSSSRTRWCSTSVPPAHPARSLPSPWTGAQMSYFHCNALQCMSACTVIY